MKSAIQSTPRSAAALENAAPFWSVKVKSGTAPNVSSLAEARLQPMSPAAPRIRHATRTALEMGTIDREQSIEKGQVNHAGQQHLSRVRRRMIEPHARRRVDERRAHQD